MTIIAASYLMIKVVSKFLVVFFEHSNFLDSSLTHEWNLKFYQSFIEVKEILASATESICDNVDNCNSEVFVAFSEIIKIWCEAYDLLKYYVPNIVSNDIDFPLNDIHLKKIKQFVKRNESNNCKEALVRK